jgi:putative heme-binding domain-containing protein
VTLADGDVLTGFLGEKSPDAVTLTDATGVARRLAMSDIKEMRRGETSVMPQGLDQVLTADELRDVLAYLQGLK